MTAAATHIRPYVPGDLQGCLALFDSNVPRFFTEGEKQDFEAFLLGNPHSYVVAERDGQLVACGGWYLRDGEARLCWGMVRQDLQGQGVGRLLVEARLQALRAAGEVRAVSITTSQLTEGFYARWGLEVTERETDGLAPGIDRVEMRVTLQEIRT